MKELLLGSLTPRTIAFYNGDIIDTNQFITHILTVMKVLPKCKYSINLCDNRYHFLVVFAASVLLNKISLLPSSRLDKEITQLGILYSDSCKIDDKFILQAIKNPVSTKIDAQKMMVETTQVVAIVFTSGSTGTPSAHQKIWGQLSQSAKRIKQRFGLNQSQQHNIVALVPAQHMFGFETTIIYPLVNEVAIYDLCPFYPLDAENALSQIAKPNILVLTPLHLKACSMAGITWSKIDFVICATDKLPQKLAIAAEKSLATKVVEIYGCSEIGAIATRQTSQSEHWQLLADYKIADTNKQTQLCVPELPQIIEIPDQIKIIDKQYFELLHRKSDIIKIGGKRGSLADLAHKLKAISGVADAVFILPDEVAGKRLRLAAFVVAPDKNIAQLRQELAVFVDAVFLPKPFIKLTELPYNALGKLPKSTLLALLKQPN